MSTGVSPEAPSTGAKRFVAVLLTLLVVPGLIGFDAWPLTAWRLFSLARADTQTRWEIDAVNADGEVETIDFDRLPMGIRNAEWPLATLPGARIARREEVCVALLGTVRDEVPDTTALRIVRNHQRLVKRDGEWVVVDDRQPFHSCGAGAP